MSLIAAIAADVPRQKIGKIPLQTRRENNKMEERTNAYDAG